MSGKREIILASVLYLNVSVCLVSKRGEGEQHHSPRSLAGGRKDAAGQGGGESGPAALPALAARRIAALTVC